MTPTAHDAGATRPEKSKIRSAWISFASRILAQLIGAAATIGLGVVVMQHYASPPVMAGVTNAALTSGSSAPAAPAVANPGVATPVPHGRAVVAVLPFINMTANRQQDALADAVTEAAITALADGNSLRVVSRTSSMRYRQTTLSLPAIARELKADYVVEGSVIVERGTARVIAQLIEGSTDQHVWARSYDLAVRDTLTFQRQIGAAIAADLERAIAANRAEQ